MKPADHKTILKNCCFEIPTLSFDHVLEFLKLHLPKKQTVIYFGTTKNRVYFLKTFIGFFQVVLRILTATILSSIRHEHNLRQNLNNGLQIIFNGFKYFFSQEDHGPKDCVLATIVLQTDIHLSY